jgi:anti-sigma factor RsiW
VSPRWRWRADAGGKLEAEPAEQAVLRRIRKMRASTRAIAARLNAEGVPARGGIKPPWCGS